MSISKVDLTICNGFTQVNSKQFLDLIQVYWIRFIDLVEAVVLHLKIIFKHQALQYNLLLILWCFFGYDLILFQFEHGLTKYPLLV